MFISSKISTKAGLLLIVLITFGFLNIFGYVQPAKASVKDWQKGISLYPQANNDFESDNFKQSLYNASLINANTATFIVPYYQTSDLTADIQPGWNTPTDQSLAAGINFAHSLGMRAAIKIHISPYYGDSWAAYIDPANREEWFKNYQNLLNKYALFAQSHAVEQFCIGNELSSLSSSVLHPDNTLHWQAMISSVRQRYSGLVIYNANWGNEKDQIAFWPQLDLIGLSAYFNLSEDRTNSWAAWNQSDIAPLAQKFNKQILFTEIGYRSIEGAFAAPWNFNIKGPVSTQEQVRDYSDFFSYWDKFDYIQGMNLWNWETNPKAGGLNNADYTVQNKPAEAVVGKWFGSISLPAAN